jgi:hypothetical protein
MSDMTVIDRGNHCEIHQGDAIAADYVASKRLATLFAAAPELLAALRYMVENAEADGWSSLMLSDAKAAIAKAEGRGE